MTIADQIQQVRVNIAEFCDQFDRKPQDVKLLAVSKTHPSQFIREAYASGITQFGESYAQEAVEKVAQCQDLAITWHFIGPIQSNKTKLIAENFDWVQSVERLKILERLNAQRPKNLAPINICIQVNMFNEAQKQGVTLELLPELLKKCEQSNNLRLRGLMVIPPKQASFTEQKQQFDKICGIFDQLKQEFPQMDTLSMGMSNDLQAAIASGSNMVRIGTAIFGQRGKNHQ